MTIKQLSEQVFALSVGWFFNGEKFTKAELLEYLRAAFRPELNTSRWVMEISLPDGRWLFSINHYSEASDWYDYFIPETREQEKALADSLRKR